VVAPMTATQPVALTVQLMGSVDTGRTIDCQTAESSPR
jgi:hypothetical protein